MGVYIKKMKMPKTCADCDLLQNQSTDDWVGKYCPLVKRYIDFLEATEHRYVDCPIVAEIQEPHGRLIDESDVINAINERLKVLRTHEVFVRKHGDIDLLGVMPYIAKIPTVIEAEVVRTNE